MIIIYDCPDPINYKTIISMLSSINRVQRMYVICRH